MIVGKGIFVRQKKYENDERSRITSMIREIAALTLIKTLILLKSYILISLYWHSITISLAQL